MTPSALLRPALLLAASFAAALGASALALPASAGDVISVPAFRAIELHGGGDAVLRHGAHQRVTLIKGDPKIARIEVESDGTLNLSPCKLNWGCPWHSELEVEIVTPAVSAVSVHGGGDLKSEGAFPRQPSLTLSVHGGGTADLRTIPADAVEANVHGGGDGYVRAEKTLKAKVHGGGDLHYWGHPSVTSDVQGGGSVEQGE